MKALAAAHAAAEQFLVGYRGKKRYVKLLTADFSGTQGTGTLIGWNWLLSHPICQRRYRIRALNRSRGHAGLYRQAMFVRRLNNFWLLRGVKPKRGS